VSSGWRIRAFAVTVLGSGAATLLPAQLPPTNSLQPTLLTNAAAVRNLTPEEAVNRLPVRIQGVVTYVFDGSSFFVPASSAGIYLGGETEVGPLESGDAVIIEGVSGPGDYAPILRPSSTKVLGRAALPAARRVSFQDLTTGREDSQW